MQLHFAQFPCFGVFTFDSRSLYVIFTNVRFCGGFGIEGRICKNVKSLVSGVPTIGTTVITRIIHVKMWVGSVLSDYPVNEGVAVVANIFPQPYF